MLKGRKKLLFLISFILLASVTLVACGGQPEEVQTPEPGTDPTAGPIVREVERISEDVMQAFELSGLDSLYGFDLVSADPESYLMLGAIGGVGFGDVTFIYEFSDEAAVDEAFDAFPFMEEQGWIRNGRFVMNSPLDEMREFFAGIVIP